MLLLIHSFLFLFFLLLEKHPVKPSPDFAELHNEVSPVAGTEEVNVGTQPQPLCSWAAEWVHYFAK